MDDYRSIKELVVAWGYPDNQLRYHISELKKKKKIRAIKMMPPPCKVTGRRRARKIYLSPYEQEVLRRELPPKYEEVCK